jgi:hypothetical protein
VYRQEHKRGLIEASAVKVPDGLVPRRTCECSACCELFAIDTPELQKAQDVLCPHCVRPAGCGIYPTRPPVCHEWHCGWRRLPSLDCRWRPDRCGVLIEAMGVEPSLTGVNFTIMELGLARRHGQRRRPGDRASGHEINLIFSGEIQANQARGEVERKRRGDGVPGDSDRNCK